jgi:heat shock protein HslJ
MNSRRTSPVLIAFAAVAALALAACGSDDAGSSNSAPPDDDENPSLVPTQDELANRAFESTSVVGHELVEGTDIGIVFEASSISAKAGCNTMFGGYQFDENALMVGTLASTMMACDQALMDQDTWLGEFLTGLPTIAYDGSSLILERDGVVITFAEIADAPIEGTTWEVTGIVAEEAVSSVPADATATFTIADGTIDVDTGCNTGSGTVEVSLTSLTFGPIATTKMACADDVMALETSVLSTLSGTVDYAIHGDTLLMTGENGDGLQLAVQS